MLADDSTPTIIAGPMLRHVSAHELTVWLVTTAACEFRLQLFLADKTLVDRALGQTECHSVPVGGRCIVHLLHIELTEPLPYRQKVEYELLLNNDPTTLAQRLTDWCYANETRASFVLQKRLDQLLHGSCRKAHCPSEDALLAADPLLAASRQNPEAAPALMMLTGDQVYVDDVAGPMLVAIHQVMAALELFPEHFDGATVADTDSLLASAHCYYEREQLLPQDQASQPLLDIFFRGARKPIFTADGAHNHLITFAEMLAMYLLCWSPSCWRWVAWDTHRPHIGPAHHARFDAEARILREFVAGLPTVRRVFGHLPTYMIFDDHDVTDDWNLTRGWEETAYGHAFSRRIIGNALTAYWLCQGWANQPRAFATLSERVPQHFCRVGLHNQAEFIEHLFAWQHWHYQLATEPPLVVLDTRTHRWRSESHAAKPSGLMDWEALSELQQSLIGHSAVVMVSPAPVFGVKLIEVIQRIFIFFRRALMVDAENWMAHRGAAHVMLNIFRHSKTPPYFVILSGDVHYSFVYDISLRGRKNSPRILQVTASGIKNRFPDKLLCRLDRLNRWLYHGRSPLNWFTKRRHMRIRRRKPNDHSGRWLYNHAGLGQVFLAQDYDQIRVKVIHRNGEVEFQ